MGQTTNRKSDESLLPHSANPGDHLQQRKALMQTKSIAVKSLSVRSIPQSNETINLHPGRLLQQKQIDHILRHSKHDGMDVVIKEAVDLMYKKLK